jgi:hypothetical protein
MTSQQAATDTRREGVQPHAAPTHQGYIFETLGSLGKGVQLVLRRVFSAFYTRDDSVIQDVPVKAEQRASTEPAGK